MPGQKIEIALQVTNKGVGHAFPAGTIDSNESWLEITARDSNNVVFYEQGQNDTNNEISDLTVTFGATFLDKFGNKTDRRNSTTEAVAIMDKHLIEPGVSNQINYTIDIPLETKMPIMINAKLNWRKYSPSFLRWVFDDREIPEIPITVISETNITL